ncbi:uncharacterized protein PG986_002122 [Apiospora aurea]|uniref:HNH nuclease domain-containing protein n=1 Tax=Apiospora aurea TaxID=335848 RepID=A0ABR1R0L8_9PEZI
MVEVKITSTFVENLPPPTHDKQPEDDASEDIRDKFEAAELLRQKLSQAINKSQDPDEDVRKILDSEIKIRLMISLLQNPEAFPPLLLFSRFAEDELNQYTTGELDFLKQNPHLRKSDTPQGTPTKKHKGKAGESSTTVSSPMPKGYRDPEMRKAQKDVPKWYGPRCVFTRQTYSVEGAHIIANHFTAKDEGHSQQLLMFKDAISTIFSKDLSAKMKRLISEAGNVKVNILPLNVNVHRGWDGYRFVIRPLQVDPDGRSMNIQFLFLDEAKDPLYASSIYKDNTKEHDVEIGGYSDWWRLKDTGATDTAETPPVRIRTGDVYKLETTDPDKYPLPSFELFILGWTVHCLRHAFKAGGAARSLFRHPPPDVDGGAAASRRK